MRKIVTSMIGIGAMLVSSIPAEAQQRHNRRYEPRPVARYYAPPRYVAPRYVAPRYVQPRNNWVPYVIGSLALGAIVGNYFYNRYGQMCHNEIVDYDYAGRALTGTFCE
jgi:hypothetical protein